MVPWPLRGWSSPALVAALLLARIACNVALTAVVATVHGTRTRTTAAVAMLTVASALLLVSVVGVAAGRFVGLLELSVQAALLALAASAAYDAPIRRRVAALAVALLAVALALGSVVL